MWDWSGTKGGYKGKVIKKANPSTPPAPPSRYYGRPDNTGYQSPYPGYGIPDYNNGYENPNYPPQPVRPAPPSYYPPPQPPRQPPYSGYPNHMPPPPPPPPPQHYVPNNASGNQENQIYENSDISAWEWQLDNFNLPGMELQEATLVLQSPRWKGDMKKAFKRARRDFLKFVGYHHKEECMEAGIDEEGLKLLKKGRSPENFNVHMKIPLDYLGTNDFSNLCLMQTYPFHIELHKFLDLQIAKQAKMGKPRRLLIPVPNGKVYIPSGAGFAPGGKDKHDRSVYAGFLESTFEIIKLKSSLGRSADI